MEMRSTRLAMVGLAALVVAAAGCAVPSGGSGGGEYSARPTPGVVAGVEGSTEDRFAPGTGDATGGGTGAERDRMTPVADRGPRVGPDGRDQFGRPSPTVFTKRPELRDIHFDFDRAEIRPDAADILEETADWLLENPSYLVLIEGHADERGTNEYNLALGDRRAKSAMNFLVARGVQTARISIVSFGEERPLCHDPYEGCWSQNRRAHFTVLNQ